MKKILYLLLIGLILTGCESFLDEMPDNRAEIDNEEKIAKLLTSAYPEYNFVLLAELSSDNIDDILGIDNAYSGRFPEQIAYWKEITEDHEENTSHVWESHYKAIATANTALQAIEELGSPKSLNPHKGEALIARAYAHFVLVNMFSLHYSPKTSDKDLGIPYIKHPETELATTYERGTVADVYKEIDKDIQEALPLISDAIYSVPKYHFNRKAALAFASRFYLYYLDYDKVIEYANQVLGADPLSQMRDYSNWGTAIPRDPGLWSMDYIRETHKSNLLLLAAYSTCGVQFGGYIYWNRFTTHADITAKETVRANTPWGIYTSASSPGANYYSYKPANIFWDFVPPYSNTFTAKMPYIFQVTDPVAQIGEWRTVFSVFQTEEVLLNRAEAYVFKNSLEDAVADLAIWQTARFNKGANTTLTLEKINPFFDTLAFFTPFEPTIKKAINPDFTVAEDQKNLIYCILHARRAQFWGEGLRWFDIKRYRIEIHRRLIDARSRIARVQETLTVDDSRRAFQIPPDVVSAGLKPNPRNKLSN
ncbi:MAG: RagB/SusD family nutrient uptake outer membrane protein [Prevotellaceae bacterium]|jgi:hypothetical protein|nr:RagB/SusD family nutrient uptake outer membrane protein [Prevotellaceae bacterium]